MIEPVKTSLMLLSVELSCVVVCDVSHPCLSAETSGLVFAPSLLKIGKD